jgi:hypothetical protein
MRTSLLALSALLFSSACVGPAPAHTDADVTTDPCSADDGDTAGCNGGFASGEPDPGAPAGTCENTGLWSDDGGCGEGNLCVAGRCLPACDAGTEAFSTSTCPTGFRCNYLGGGLCFRDCDDAHACPSGMACESGMCLPPF